MMWTLLALALGCADMAEADDTGLLDTAEDIDTNKPWSDPMGLVGEWLVLPVLVGEEVGAQYWPEDWPDADLSTCDADVGVVGEWLSIGSAEMVATWALVCWSGGDRIDVLVSRPWASWEYSDGYMVDGHAWTVTQIGDSLSVVSGTDSMMLAPR